MPTIKISVEDAKEMIWDTKKVIRTKMIDHRRWSITKEVIFLHDDDKFYCFTFHDPATEYQDGDRFSSDENDMITCFEVEQFPSVDYRIKKD